MPWFKPPDPLKFSCLGCLWTNPCYHTSQSTTVTNYTKERSLQTGDNYWMHSFPPFTGHQNQRSQSSQMLAIWDCWFRISKYSVTRSLFLQQVNESWTNSTGHLNTVRRLRDLHKICHPVLLRWPSDTYQQTPPKKKVHCQNAPNPPLLQPNPRYPYESPVPGISIVHGIGPFEGQQIMRSLRGTSHLAKAWSWSRERPLGMYPLNGQIEQWKKTGDHQTSGSRQF